MAVKHTIRQGPWGRTYKTVVMARTRAIRYFCVECCGYSPSEPKLCQDVHCPLYPFRLGTVDPAFVECPDEEQEEEISED